MNECAEFRLCDHKIDRFTQLLANNVEEIVHTIEILCLSDEERVANRIAKDVIIWLI